MRSGDYMEKYDVKFKKKFGQNFLKDINIVKKIVLCFWCTSLLNFSIAVNLNYSYLNDLLRGKKHITLNKIDCICKSLNISVTELLDFTPLITMQEEKCFIKFPSIENIFINYY